MNYAIVDIETTGSYTGGNSITEIAIIIHNGIHILEKYQTLVNPRTIIPFHIQALTGISNEMVENAPTFSQIAAQVYDLLKNNIFVAHNVNFDYSFVSQELKLAGYNWQASKLCTVKLAKKIIPNLASYSLGKLCQNLRIQNNARHRAMGDALATTILFEQLIQKDKEGIIDSAIKNVKEVKLPSNIYEEEYHCLSEKAGIYLFRNKTAEIIYVGKGKSIKKAVSDHFANNRASQKTKNLSEDIYSIDHQESGTELMASLMECQIIQEYRPKYNTTLKKYEPKFVLISYEDQNGYIRLLVSPYTNQAHAIQYFERPVEANQLLLQLIEKFDLNSQLCSFYTEQNYRKPKIDYSNLLDVSVYNDLVLQAIDYVCQNRKSFYILDQGRNINEKSYIYFKNDALYAFGFIDVNHQFSHIEDAIKKSDLCLSNYYMTSLVLQYVEKYPSKIIRIK